MAIELRSIDANEVGAFRKVILETFGHDPPRDADKAADRERAFIDLVDLARTYVASADGELVGVGASFDFDLTIPGSSCPMGGLTMVAVRPTHRRRGILRRIMGAHFEDVRRHGEPVSGLWASESSIYGRFGYGRVGDSESVELTTTNLRINSELVTDSTRLLELGDAITLLPEIYNSVRVARPGMLTRSTPWWKHRNLNNDTSAPSGASNRRVVVSERDGRLTGYALFRQQPKLDGAVFDGTIGIIEIIAIDEGAEASLWHFLTNIDLFPRVQWWNAPSDSILPWIVSDPRRLKRQRTDHLWLRIDDPGVALAARRYKSDGHLRLEVEGERFELEISGGQGSCQPSTKHGELICDRAALGSIYLGGVKPSVLHRAGIISGDRQAAERADQLMSWPVAPWCPEVF